MLEKLGGRKITLGFIFLAVAVALALALGDLPKNLMEFMIFLSAGFFLGNGAEHIAGALVKPSAAPVNIINTDEIDAKLEALKQDTANAVSAAQGTTEVLSKILESLGNRKQ